MVCGYKNRRVKNDRWKCKSAKKIWTLLSAMALGLGGAQAGIILLDYSDGAAGGGHDVAVRGGDFEDTADALGTAAFSAHTNWTNLRGSQSTACSFLGTGSESGVGGPHYAYMQGSLVLYGQSLEYTIQAGDRFTGSLMYDPAGNSEANDHLRVTLFYTADNSLTTNGAVDIYTFETSDYLGGWTTASYTSGVIAPGDPAIGKTLLYRFEALGDPAGPIEFMWSDNHYLAVENPPPTVIPNGIPVTSQQIDVGDDPENAYSGAPQFDQAFFGNQTRIITKYPANYLNHRNSLGVDYSFYFLETKSFTYPPAATIANVIQATPTIPVIEFAKIGKINRDNEDGEKAFAQDPAVVNAFVSHYPNVIFGGGQTAEVDGDFIWLHPQYYGRLPVGPGARAFPFAYLDFTESNLKRSGVPYLLQQHNQGWGTHYVAKERAMSLGGPQLFYRGSASIVDYLATARSAARQYPHPMAVQFSGQPNLLVSNTTEVLNNGATPIYTLQTGAYGENYHKSYALNRQALYLSWLNGASSFNWEVGEFINSVAADFPSPLGTFTKKASDLIASFGPTGPVQTPIAIISEFYNTWHPPEPRPNGFLYYLIAGDAPYATGDYQLHGLRNFFYPNYLQCERIYEASMGEDFALAPTPYGNSVDYLLSDVRPAALPRYGLLVWGGVPPEAPAMVREKLLGHITQNQGRVVVFGAAARRMFPEWFTNSPATVVAAGATITYGQQTLTEASSFTLEHLRGDLDTAALSLNILASVNGDPLIVECLGGLVLVLSDYGMNRTQFISPTSARWYDNQLITEVPHRLLNHARRLLDDEAVRQTPFSVGNTNLHYVVTRPQAGEYVIGIFNDKLTSEPFNITSAIGPITNQLEVALDDNKAELQSAAGGAAYAPPGLRTSPSLPLNYGLSDATHIEGRDFRLFRLRVAENGVWQIPAIQYPNRPAGRVLAVAGMESIRPYLQGISSFLQWFDGVKLTAAALLTLEDNWITEQAHWLDRRGVRVVVDGAGINEATALLVVNKLSLIHSGRKDLIISAPSPAVQSAAALAGVSCRDPAVVHRVYRKGERFSPTATLNIVDRHYRNEEDLFWDLRHFETGEVVAELRGELTSAELNVPLSVPPNLTNDFFYVGSDVTSLTEMLQHEASEFSKLRGVKVDSTYLLAKTTNALAADAVTLVQLGLEVVVDLRRDQMHFDRIAFYPHIPNYSSGTNLFREIITKMQVLGATNLILRIQDVGAMRNDAAYIAQRDATWNAFADLALTRNISLHLIFEPSLTFSSTNGFSKPNVFVIKGSKGNASPFRLVDGSTTTGVGPITIHDENRGLYAAGLFESAAIPKLSFNTWAAGYGITGEALDADGDDAKNLFEFALGGDPTNAVSQGTAPSLIYSVAGSSYVYSRRKNGALIYWLETSTNLTSWVHDKYVEHPVAGVIDDAYESVTNFILTDAAQFFVRLMVAADRTQP
jgi:hypothetical protein